VAAAVDAAVRAGVDWIQLRERELDGAALLRFAGDLCDVARRAALARDGSVKILINRRIDVALAIGADGVHLGFDAVAPQDAAAILGVRRRRVGSAEAERVGAAKEEERVSVHAVDVDGDEDEDGDERPAALIGVSAHSTEDVAAAARGGASYAHLAPIWPPLSKSGTRPAIGLAAVEAAARLGLPLLAQGGVRPDLCAAALAAGAAGVAVTGDILMAEDPGRAAAALRAALDRWPARDLPSAGFARAAPGPQRPHRPSPRTGASRE
jgi:thiamine-phosphate pyrophosphorylase